MSLLHHYVGTLFVSLSVVIYVFAFYLLPIRLSKGGAEIAVLEAVAIGSHLFLTFIIYWFSFREDVKRIDEDVFSRTKKTIILLVVASLVALLVLILAKAHLRYPPIAVEYLLVPYITLSFSAITLSTFISIMIWRSGVRLKVWTGNTVLTLITAFFLLGVSFFSFLIFIAASLAP